MILLTYVIKLKHVSTFKKFKPMLESGLTLPWFVNWTAKCIYVLSLVTTLFLSYYHVITVLY